MPMDVVFTLQFSGFFLSLRDELREMIHLPDPENTPASARRGMKVEIFFAFGSLSLSCSVRIRRKFREKLRCDMPPVREVEVSTS